MNPYYFDVWHCAQLDEDPIRNYLIQGDTANCDELAFKNSLKKALAIGYLTYLSLNY